MVKIFTSTEEFIHARNEVKDKVGFVPTMGNLHAGHISLLEMALSEYKVVCFSIFVNPKQFGPNEDFAHYPRTLRDDINLIEKLMQKFPNSFVLVYAPKTPAEVFPDNQNETISVGVLSTILEGAIRPGHFDGVTTVVHRLFEIARPEKAYFGLKDYQQYVVIKKMVKDLSLPVVIKGMPIIREESGLALSSRNQYLSPEQKEKSLVLYQSLQEVVSLINHERKNLPLAQKRIDEILKDKNWNYLEIRDSLTLDEDISHSKEITILGVYQLGTTRLLDNMQMELK